MKLFPQFMAVGVNQKTHIRIKRSHERFFRNQPRLKLPNTIMQLSENPSSHIGARNASVRKRDITQIVDPLPEFSNLNFIGMKGQIKTSFQKIGDFIFEYSKIFIVMVKNNKVVRITKIKFSFKLMLCKLIKFVHINIGKHLRCQIADRRTLDASFLVGVGSKTFNDNSDQVQNVPILDFAADNLQKDLVVDGRKELPDVAFEREAFSFGLKNFARVYAKLLYTLMGSFLFSARIRIGYKGRFKNRVKETKNCVMDDPIADDGFVDMPQFRIADIKIDILAVSVSFMDQIAMKLDIGFAPLAPLESKNKFKLFFFALSIASLNFISFFKTGNLPLPDCSLSSLIIFSKRS